MHDRNVVLAQIFAQKLPLIRVHAVNPLTGICSCMDSSCRTPGKHPIDRYGVNSARPYRNAEELGHCNVGLATGTIVVIDVDPRNGGNETLKELEGKYGELPHTWLSKTGGGGYHYFFQVHEAIRSIKTYSKRGIDIQGLGAYVLLPSSFHATGREYEWIVEPEDLQIASLPDWVLTLVPEISSHSVEKTLHLDKYSPHDVKDALALISSDCTYDEWVRVGMALYSAGVPLHVWQSWSSQSTKYPGDAAIEKKWASFKGNGVGIGTLFYIAEQYGWREKVEVVFEKKKPQLKKTEADSMKGKDLDCARCTTHSTQNLLTMSSGIVREIADILLNNAYREYSNWAIASSLAILATVFQQSFLSPEGKPISLFQIIPGRAAQGKDDYLFGAKSLINTIDRRLCMNSASTGAGLVSELFSFNSKFEGIDEFQDAMGKMAKGDNQFIKEKLTMYKLLYNGTDVSIGSTKMQASCRVIDPKLSILAFGTPEQIAEIMNSDNIGGGLISRFMQWPKEKAVLGTRKTKKQLDWKTVDYLRSIIRESLVSSEKEDTYLEREKDFRNGKTKHNNIFKEPTIVSESDDAAKLFREFSNQCQNYYINNPDADDAAAIDRSVGLAYRIATIHAVGCKRAKIEQEDASFGLAIAKLCASEISSAIAEITMSETTRKLHASAVRLKNWMVRNELLECSLRDFARNLHLTKREAAEVTDYLVDRGELIKNLSRCRLIDPNT